MSHGKVVAIMYNPSEDEKKFLQNYDASKYPRPSVTADIVIFTIDESNNLNVLLIKRGGYPYQNYWAIPGGFLDVPNESINDAAARELYEETGVQIQDGIDLRQLITVGTPDRDPRTYVVSVVYTALVPKGLLNIVAGDDAKAANLFRIESVTLPDGKTDYKFVSDDCTVTTDELAFDHANLIDIAIERIRGRLSYTHDAFALLANKDCFEIYELQKIHEAILGRPLDRSNFRKAFVRDYVGTGIVEIIGQHDAPGKPQTSMYKYKG